MNRVFFSALPLSLALLLIFPLLGNALTSLSSPGSVPGTRTGKSTVGTALAAEDKYVKREEAGSSRYLFGVVYDNGNHHNDLWRRGARAITFELKWRLYQPSPGIYDDTYISHMKQLLRSLKRQGWTVQLVPGYHYVPQWVFDAYPETFFVNQYGQAYDPDPAEEGDFRVINAPFNPQARALISAYLARLFQDFNQSDPELAFDSVRIGGGPQGELRYPPPEWSGAHNSYWAFDSHAQNPRESGIPESVVGWRPGIDPNPGSEGRGQRLVNPGFEREESGFDVFAWSPDDEVTAAVVPDSHDGSSALQLEVHSNRRIHQYVRVQPGADYELGGWLKSGGAFDGSRGQARIIVTQYGAAGELLADVPFTKLENPEDTWVQGSGTITASPETLFLKFEMDGDKPGIYFFDNVWLKESGETNSDDRDIDVPLTFYTWYVDRLEDYQRWQIQEMRKYFPGRLDVVYAGKGVNANQITDALDNDLFGDGRSEGSSGLYSGSDYATLIDSMPESPTGTLSVYVTGIEVPAKSEVDDYSPYPGEWSAARWVAHLARRRSLPIWGENSGANNREEMELSVERMRQNGFFGLLWAFSSEMYSGEHATADDYEEIIGRYTDLHYAYIPQVLIP